MTVGEIISLIISIITAGLMIPAYASMKSVVKNYKLQPIKTDSEISSGFIKTALDANELAEKLQKQMKILTEDDEVLKREMKKVKVAEAKKTIIILELRKQLRKLKAKITRLEMHIQRLKDEIVSMKRTA